MESVGIKESQELLECLEVLAVAGKKIGADGKLSVHDLPVVMGILQNAGIIMAGFQGVKEIKDEAKDYSAEELQALGAKVISILAAVKAA
jgi:hypothetical protein